MAELERPGQRSLPASLRLLFPLAWISLFWASRVHDTGVGVAIPRRSLTVDGLVQALLEVLNKPSFATAARDLSANMKSEDGVARAVNVISRVAQEQRSDT